MAWAWTTSGSASSNSASNSCSVTGALISISSCCGNSGSRRSPPLGSSPAGLRLPKYVDARAGEILDRYIGPSITMLRARMTGSIVQALLSIGG